jgi:hypothetical protein
MVNRSNYKIKWLQSSDGNHSIIMKLCYGTFDTAEKATFLLLLICSARMDFSEKYYIEDKTRDVRCDEKSILRKTCQW